MLNILLVEDDEFFRAAVASVLQAQKWTVTLAPDGVVARDIVKAAKPFDVIVSDIQMPFLTGVELLEWVKENKPTPFVLMTGFALVMETQRAHDLGADDFLAKPFETSELIEVIKRVCHTKLAAAAAVAAQPNMAAPKSDYCKVNIEEFVAAPTLNFDVYVKLGAERFLKIGRKGDAIPKERIENFKGKGLLHLYIRKEDFQQLVTFNLNLAKVVAGTSKVSHEKKANFMRYTGEVILEKAFISGIDKESFNEASDFLTTSMDVLTDEPTALDLLESLNAHADNLYAHSLCVSVYSIMIAKKLKWTSTANLFKLSLAGIFHDIGKKEIDRAIVNKARPLLTYAERQLIETHPIRGREILLSLPSIPSEVVAVAYEHHEDNLGTGYPRALTKLQIHPFTQIVRVANFFAEFTLKSPSHPGMAPGAALAHVERHYGDALAQDALKALKEILREGKAAA